MIKEELNKAIVAVERYDAMTLREISQRMSALAVTDQEKEVVDLAIIAYALNKMYSKAHFKDKVGGFRDNLLSALRSRNLEAAISLIDKFDEQHGFFQGGLIGKARIKVGSRIYSQGLSLSTAASLTGAAAADLQDYVGGTKTEYPSKAMSINDRIEIARKIFK
jgi:hypothetical protein